MATGGLRRDAMMHVKALFFDRQAVMDQVDRVTRRAMSLFGLAVRRRAQKSILPARQKHIRELTPEETIAWRIAKREARRAGRPAPRRPLLRSLPGAPPRSVTGILRKHIYYGLDQQTRSVVIGPALLPGGTGAPQILEEGGTVRRAGRTLRIDARPYMAPAFQRELPNYPDYIRQARIKVR